mgnify:CR=1 FL=1
MNRTDYIQPVEKKKPDCIHARVKVPFRCRDCGAITRSHPLDGAVKQQAQCPDCGRMINVFVQLFQCHKCWERELAEKPKQPEEL